ncbi:BTB/POZ domain-containing protein At5g48130 [Macadamia integrifolia]|uniref:BTB/POZ domain-containing protein At5g48130 n=1 Tax=Macadamia integrifolia TaxID=60698 RepID=UPI001C52EB2D|nr:BTB/POZ domain-containing protein At5g48130 [Macadamia integrifolia]
MMDVASPKTNPLVPSPFSSPNVAALLKIKIIAWSQETGLPVSVRVRVDDKVFELHKHPLLSKSGYFKKALNGSTELELPGNFPGGSKVFEMIALFTYGFSAPIDPFNVAALRCAAEFLEMTEDYGCGNLCERTDLYLNQVALQSWDDTLIVLQKCQTLLPWSEELLIVCRCLESLAFMACMEILDPERRRERPVVTLDALANQAWNCEAVKEIAGQDLWIKDFIALPFEFFKRIIGSLRRQGMKEKYVSPLVVFYANKWVISKKTNQFWLNMDDSDGAVDATGKVSVILQGILDLLPMGEKASRVIPVGFYFALLSKALHMSLKSESKIALQDQIVSLLQMAQVDDFLLPGSGIEAISSSMELVTMESIVSSYVSLSSNQETSIVAGLWDTYLSRIASDPEMEPRRFMDLTKIIPISHRQTHDHLYRAMSNFLLEHPNLSQEEKASVCKHLNCQKLSQETCIEAVQNEFMPLRLIVQALFVQQLNTHKAFKDCSDSFTYVHRGDFSGSIPSSRYPNTNSQNLGDQSPYKEAVGGESISRPLGFLLQKDVISRKDYESTSFRIQSLEQELMSLKRSLQWQMMPKESEPINCDKPQSMRPYGLQGRTMSKKKNPLGQVTGCIGSVSFTSQRKYANSLLKVFRRFVLFGKGKSKTKKSPSSLWPSNCSRNDFLQS